MSRSSKKMSGLISIDLYLSFFHLINSLVEANHPEVDDLYVEYEKKTF